MRGELFTRRDFLARAAGATLALPLTGGASLTGAGGQRRGPVCLFSKHLQWLDYDAMAETAATIGFEGVALTVRPGGHVAPERVEEQLPRAVEAVRGAGLIAPMMTTAITDADDPLTERILRTAAALEIGYYRMGYLSYDENQPVNVYLDELARKMGLLADMNRTYGLHGAYQNHDGTRVGGAVWDIWYMLRSLDPQWIGCQFDIRHATVEGGHSWPVALRLISPYVHITAIKDFYWDRSGGQWRVADVPLGEGAVDFDRYLTLARSYGVDGPISVHFEYPMPDQLYVGRSEEWLKKETIRVMARDVNWLKDALERAGYTA